MPFDCDTDVHSGVRLRVLIALFLLGAWASMGVDGMGPRKVHFREPHRKSYILDGPSTAEFTLARRDGSTNRYELSNRVVLQIEPGKDINALLANRPAQGAVPTVSRIITPNLFILQAANSRAAIDLAESLADKEGVVASYPVMRRPLRHQNSYAPVPNDPFFNQLWQLDNRGTDGNLDGPDLSVRSAWPFAVGAGVLVAVADEGLQLDHPELTNAASGGPHYNFFNSTSNGAPYSSIANHATAVAGLISAEKGNQRGVAGVAPQSKLASWVIWGDSFGQEVIATDEQLMDMFQYVSNRVAVQNHSWANATPDQFSLDVLSDIGISNAVTHGRGGKGVVIVRAAGNGRDDASNANDDGYANDPRAITVAAVRKDGGRACSYSNPGACLLVAAPSGDLSSSLDGASPDVLTTDRTGSAGYNTATGDSGDYTGFNGTSASSPQVAGVVALVLSANTNLAVRDVQQILALSARHYDFADPSLHTNGAGLRFSHNVGFGIPDAGFAVQLAKAWSNRPPAKQITVETNFTQGIPDDALRVLCEASGLSSSLSNIHCLPSLGEHPDVPTPSLPLVYVGQANAELTDDLHGKGALIQRGTSLFRDKIARAARAGASFAIIFNNTTSPLLQAMGGTDFAPIPAVSISQVDGEALRDFIALHPETTAHLQLTSAVYQLTVTNTLLCEHVGLRLKTTHPNRADVRVTLLSPVGTRSVLQAINSDPSAGPSDWTYWSCQHLYESSAGEWRLEVSDERSADVGSATYAQLILIGVEITDTDHDGLDDNWELQHFGDLAHGPKDDPDDDGINNAREQILGTDPTAPDTMFKLDIAALKWGHQRISWPARDTATYTILFSTNVAEPFTTVTNIAGRLPVSEFVVKSSPSNSLFRVRQSSD